MLPLIPAMILTSAGFLAISPTLRKETMDFGRSAVKRCGKALDALFDDPNDEVKDPTDEKTDPTDV